SLVPDFYQLWPERFSNKTNGVTQRRWLAKSNQPLAALLTDAIGDGWITELGQLRKLEGFAADPEFQDRFLAAKQEDKKRLANTIKQANGINVDPASLFDVQTKRIHEYKRQLLMVMRVLHEYLSVIEDRREPQAPRTYIFAGKAAPSYWAAKQIIKLVNE